MSAPGTPAPNDEDRVEAELGRGERPDSRIRFEYPEGPDGRVRMTDYETGATAEGADHDEAAELLAERIKALEEAGGKKLGDGTVVYGDEAAMTERDAAKKRGKEAGFPFAMPDRSEPVIPWTIKKYDRNSARSITEIRTAHHRANLLIVLLRADGSGSTVIGAGSTSAVEISWDDITEGVEYLERLYR